MVPPDAQWLGNGVRVGWKSRAGHVYQLEHSDSLDEWLPAAGAPLRYGTGGWMEADDILAMTPARGFTRLKIYRHWD